MEEWVTVEKVYQLEEQARKAAQVISITESRLLSSKKGAQYDIVTEVVEVPDGWQIRWRKVMVGYDSGCSGCGSCQSKSMPAKNETKPGKVLLFKPKQNKGKRD